MKTISGLITLFCLSAFLVLGGCGGGGSSSTTTATPTPTATNATVKLSTQGPLAQNVLLSGIGVSISLPAGVTVATANGEVLSEVVHVTGVAASGTTVVGPMVYHPATTVRGTFDFSIAASNFGIGEFATVKFIVAPGSSPPTKDDVTITPADQGLNPVTGLTVGLAVVP
jgi:hypothetical protein